MFNSFEATDPAEAVQVIDAGDPTDNAGIEPAPNSNRINLGAYGGTRQASLGLDSDLDNLGDAEEDINGNGI